MFCFVCLKVTICINLILVVQFLIVVEQLAIYFVLFNKPRGAAPRLDSEDGISSVVGIEQFSSFSLSWCT